MALWINFPWNNSFVNLMQLPLLCEKTGALAIVKRVLQQAGRQEGKQAVRQTKLLKI